MRIHRLRLQAYGPFPGNIDLDFDGLNRAGIFLLNGPTGAGKSSLLDAICFALYGTTSLERPDLKSHFAPDHRQPRVELDCTVGTTRLHIERTPAWERPKKRGGGTVVEPATVLVQSLRSADTLERETKATRNDEAAAYLTDLIGLNRKQFIQVMLLPQGEFARFLTARSKDREELLKKLFPTADFERVQLVLAERAREARDRAQEAQERLERHREDAAAALQRSETSSLYELVEDLTPLLGGEDLCVLKRRLTQLDDAAADTEKARPGEDSEGTAESSETLSFERFLTDSVDRLAGAVEAIVVCRDGLEARVQRLRQKIAAQQQLVELWGEYGRLREQEEKLLEQKPTHRADIERLRAARAAELVLPGYRGVRGAAEEKQAAFQQLETRQRAAAEFASSRAVQPAVAGKPGSWAIETVLDLDSLKALRDSIAAGTEAQQRLHTLAALDAERVAEEEKCRQLEQKLSTLDEEADALSTLHAQREGDRTRLHREREELGGRAALVQDLGRQVSAAEKTLREAIRLENIREQLVAAGRKAREDEQARQEITRTAEKLQALRYSQAAQILADRLTPDSPCPVCGSIEHPQPAQPDGLQLVEEQQVTRALESRGEAEERARESRAEVAGLSAQVNAAEESEVPDRQRAQEELARVRIQLNRAEEAAGTLKECEQKLGNLDRQQEELTRRMRVLEIDRASLAAAYEQHEEHHRQLVQRMGEESSETAEDTPSFAEREQQIKIHLKNLEEVVAGLQRLDSAGESEARARKELDRALAQSPFDQVEAVVQAALAPETIEQLEEDISTYRDSLSGLRARLASEPMRRVAVLQAEGHPAPSAGEIRQLEHSLTEHEKQRDVLLAAETRHRSAARELADIAESYRNESGRVDRLIDEYRMRNSLAETANGIGADNRLAMTLTTYVLAAQLEEVTRAATLHLEQMTHGRYRLEYTDEKLGRGKSGLGIEVFDTWHARRRLPTTLSGGETFMASLALALGLADVVQQRNGGIEIDTLFVDEGFGSLDDSTLEEVMGTLDGLRQRGRVIGLISHVSEMKNRIPHHVYITTSPQGSQIAENR